MPIYVQHEVLGRIPDVFNAEAIWQAPGLALFSRRPLLRDLLERSPREHKGRAATRCFSHVTLMLPQEEVDDDYHLTRGARARDLAQTLTALHQKDFGDLLRGDQVRYDVVGTEALAPGEIEVKFGHAVYLPAADEKILYNVSVSRDSAIWHSVCPIYPNQRLALIGGEGGEASFIANGWPFGTDGAILIVNDGPDAAPVVQMRPKDAFECRFDPRSGYHTIKSLRDVPGGSPRLMLRIARTGAAAVPAVSVSASMSASASPPPAFAAVAPINLHAAPARAGKPAVWQSRSAARRDPSSLAATPDGAPPDPTAVPGSAETSLPTANLAANKPGESDATYAPVSQQRVSVVALALPRLSRYRDTGAQTLELPFNRALTVCASGAPVISFVVDAADELYACTAAGRERIATPATFTPVDARAIRLLPAAPEMADRYRAVVCLPEAVGAAVASGARFTFGRNAPMLASLRLLDSPRFIQRADGGAPASADRIGLSRNAFSFEATAQGYKIGRLTASQGLYHLDDKMNFVASVGDATADAPYVLPSGHHLVAGHYVLRFDA